jgi:hypothetical protein
MTLVHGDFAPKNMRVRHAPAGLVLDAYDWGSAGWGVPALDLAQAGGPHEVGNDWPSPDLEVYRSGIRDTWSTVDKQDLEFCAALGKAFRCVYCIDRESEWLGQPSIDKAMWNMRLYCSALGHVLRVTGWR